MTEIFAIGKILDERRSIGGGREYRVHWKGYSVEESTWEPEANVCFHSDAEEETALEEFEVEDILDRRLNDSGIEEFLIHWKGYSLEESTWEPETHLDDVLLREMRLRDSNQRKPARDKRKRNDESDELYEFDPEDERESSDEEVQPLPKRSKREQVRKRPQKKGSEGKDATKGNSPSIVPEGLQLLSPATEHSTHRNASESPLVSLPTELRLMIFEYVVNDYHKNKPPHLHIQFDQSDFDNNQIYDISAESRASLGLKRNKVYVGRTDRKALQIKRHETREGWPYFKPYRELVPSTSLPAKRCKRSLAKEIARKNDTRRWRFDWDAIRPKRKSAQQHRPSDWEVIPPAKVFGLPFTCKQAYFDVVDILKRRPRIKPKFRVFSFGGPYDMKAWLDDRLPAAKLKFGMRRPKDNEINAVFLPDSGNGWVNSYPLQRLGALKVVYLQREKTYNKTFHKNIIKMLKWRCPQAKVESVRW